jgi:hypothetical protein
MIEQASPDQVRDSRLGPDRTAFLSSHRAQSVGVREFTRFTDTLVAHAKRIATQNAMAAPVLRMAPERCIIQLGPVALTAAHIRTGNDVPPGGQLLCIIWKGTIAPRGEHIPERLGARHVPVPPVSVWEESLTVSADNESSWHWHPRGLEREGYTSTELAERCIVQLEQAFEKNRALDALTAGDAAL